MHEAGKIIFFSVLETRWGIHYCNSIITSISSTYNLLDFIVNRTYVWWSILKCWNILNWFISHHIIIVTHSSSWHAHILFHVKILETNCSLLVKEFWHYFSWYLCFYLINHLLQLVQLHDLGSFLVVFHSENLVSPLLTFCEWQIQKKHVNVWIVM